MLEAQRPAAAGPGLVRVVIVDDSEPIRSLLTTLLGDAACIVAGTAGDGAEAIEVVRATEPDVVIMDLHMPGMDGLEALQRLIPECGDTRFVMFTSGDARAIAACLAAGARRHFPKQDIVELIAYVDGLRAG
jgi:CheY-like chemotaxis protein